MSNHAIRRAFLPGVLLIVNCPSIAGAYAAHRQSRWAQGQPWQPSY